LEAIEKSEVNNRSECGYWVYTRLKEREFGDLENKVQKRDK
jgi:hypothetical protein